MYRTALSKASICSLLVERLIREREVVGWIRSPTASYQICYKMASVAFLLSAQRICVGLGSLPSQTSLTI